MAPAHPTSAATSSPVSAVGTPAELTWPEVDAVLAELAVLVPRLIDDYRGADAETNRWSEAREAYLDDPHRSPQRVPDPRRAITAARAEIAEAAGRALRKAVREMTAWWADAATYALAAAVLNKPVRRFHLTAADPTAFLDDVDLAALPAPSQHHRDLAGLAARMGGAEMLEAAKDLAEQSGLAVRWSLDGEPEVVDDVYPEGRRRRMWGPFWTRYRLPALPGTDELVDLLTTHGAPDHIVAEIRAARDAVQDVVEAELVADPPDDPDPDNEPRPDVPPLDGEALDRLFGRAEQAPEVLAGYARTLTAHLPALRAAASR